VNVVGRLASLGLYLSLVVPSFSLLDKYTGLAGVIVHGTFVAAVIWFLRRTGLRSLNEGRAAMFAVAAWFAICGVFWVTFPVADGRVFGPGSDTDEAYDFAVREMLDGNYPYYVETYLANSVHHLPGALLLATPFVLLGTSAYQNLFWLPLFFVVAQRELRDGREALMLWLLVLLLCPAVMHSVVTGTDGVMNGLSVLVGMWAVARSHRSWTRLAASVLLALAVSNRPNFALALPPMFALLVAASGWATAFRWAAGTILLLAAINLPFYLHDPARFAPLEGLNRVTRFEPILPYAGYVLPGLATSLTVVLSTRVRTFMAAVAVVAFIQALFVVSGIALSSAQAGTLNLGYAGYGTFFVFSGTLASWYYRKAQGE
jgi:hypothetical protein